jgi:hypothetical protein
VVLVLISGAFVSQFTNRNGQPVLARPIIEGGDFTEFFSVKVIEHDEPLSVSFATVITRCCDVEFKNIDVGTVEEIFAVREGPCVNSDMFKFQGKTFPFIKYGQFWMMIGYEAWFFADEWIKWDIPNGIVIDFYGERVTVYG